MIKETTPEFETTDVLAERFGVQERRIRNWCRRGYLPGARKIGNAWFVNAAEFRASLAEAERRED